LSEIELKNACNLKIKGKTPGPDLITQEIIVHAYNAIPKVFLIYILYILIEDITQKLGNKPRVLFLKSLKNQTILSQKPTE